MKKYAILLGTILLGLASLSYAQAPVPFINLPLLPDATAPGGPEFTLTVNGTGFVSNSVVNWNGTALATQFVSGSQLTATVPAADIATASTGWVTVVNPAPGGGTSNTAFFTVTANVGKSLAFTLASSPATGNGPWSVAVGDFNGDGKLDLAVADWGDFASVLLGNGTGNFTLAWSGFVGFNPQSVAVGDFNGDGKLDLAVANLCSDQSCLSGSVSILLGDGTGNFTLTSSPVVGLFPYSVAVGDFNGDGKLDLAVANEQSNTISILLGDGTGNFTLASSSPLGSYPCSVAVGDFNGDGRLDLAVANLHSNTVSVLLQVPPSPAVTLSPTSLTFGTQLVGTSSSPQYVTLSNTGSGTLDITNIAPSANFYERNNCGSSLAVGASCTIHVVFRPRVRGALTGTITITDNASNSPQTVSLSAVSTSVTLLPSSLNFGSQPVGTTSQPQTVTLTNYGTEALSIGRISSSGARGAFAQTNTCGTSVPAGGTCTISVTFTPTLKVAYNATLYVYDNGGASPQTVALSGTGT